MTTQPIILGHTTNGLPAVCFPHAVLEIRGVVVIDAATLLLQLINGDTATVTLADWQRAQAILPHPPMTCPCCQSETIVICGSLYAEGGDWQGAERGYRFQAEGPRCTCVACRLVFTLFSEEGHP
jgi:hypothetical protein